MLAVLGEVKAGLVFDRPDRFRPDRHGVLAPGEMQNCLRSGGDRLAGFDEGAPVALTSMRRTLSSPNHRQRFGQSQALVFGGAGLTDCTFFTSVSQ